MSTVRGQGQWYVHEDATEGADYTIDALTGLTRTTYLEDIDLIQKTQQGVSSRSFTRGPIVAKTEPLMYSYVTAYWSLMRTPPGLSTPREK